MLIDVIIWLIIVGVAGTARRPNSSRVTVLEFNIVVGIIGSSWQVGFCHWPALFSSAASSQRSLTPSSGR